MSGAGSAGSLAQSKIVDFVQAQFLPLGLLTAVVVGLLYPTAGVEVGKIPVCR